MTILLIDTDAFFAKIYTRKIEERGWLARVATSADSGLRKAVSDAPACIVLDLLLPEKDGFHVLDELKADEKTSSIPVFILSDLCEVSDIERCTASGACGYAIKAHARPDDVLDRIAHIVTQRAVSP